MTSSEALNYVIASELEMSGPLNLRVNGYLYDLSVRYLPKRSRPTLLKRYERFFSDPNYRMKLYCAPNRITDTIPAYGPRRTQLRITPGSIIFGYGFNVRTGVTSAPDVFVQVIDPSTSVPLFSSFIRGSGAAAGVSASRGKPSLLMTPIPVPDTGLLAVEMANKSGVPAQCQFILWVKEPAQVVLSNRNQALIRPQETGRY